MAVARAQEDEEKRRVQQAAEAEREARHAEHERAARRAEAERGKLKKRGAIMVVGDMQRARKVAASLRLPEVLKVDGEAAGACPSPALLFRLPLAL